ncbi:MAG TPA: AAA family ATPase, partial [Caldilineaceae bacterium]|nr:AAA family ATPase [Caldilineaceae bacterium]
MEKTSSTVFISFGDWVQQRRLALDLTRPALAHQVGCSPITIKKIERDERRPSLQIAELLAKQLLIPETDRDKFLQIARGAYVPTPLSAPDLLSLPSFFRSADPIEINSPPIVARERELARLTSQLESALAGNGNILFITGEAGDGKTMLAQAFLRQSQEQQPDLLVAIGNCNAYTGIGDPYLPFRELLELLTGDVESRWAAGALSQPYAERLWHGAPHVIESLLEVAPDLVGTILMGPPLLARAQAVATEESSKGIARLQALVTRHEIAQSSPHLQQSNLFAQTTRLLQSVARRQPLLLIVDDLQWADSGSLSLLFHLGRHLHGQRIMVIGIYRAAEVALGRGRERHPLEPVVNELQRIYGDIHIQLSQADSRHFVDALIDSEPNQLDHTFRDALYRQTAGHPLFTVEMLHGLQERGDLVRNEQEEWVENPRLDWGILPARVEGLIKERIQRLPAHLQELLQIASVAGESFCAEIIAHVQGSNEREVIARLGTTLDRQQRLISVQGSQQVGSIPLSHYRFRHILFQQYLYNTLDPIQRSYLHRAIANRLVECYGPQANMIAAQLARHYTLSGDTVEACHWLAVAGEMAAAIYAHTEAAALYRRAIELCRTVAQPRDPHQLSRLYRQLGRTLELDA